MESSRWPHWSARWRRPPIPGFSTSLENEYKRPAAELEKRHDVANHEFDLGHGDVVIAAITSCTNTSNPSVLIAAGLVAAPALANPVDGVYFDAPGCDDHGDRLAVEELGTGTLFPQDELISAFATITDMSACAMTDDASVANMLVRITNLSGQDWTDLFYVGDGETTFSNVDGFASTNELPPPNSLLTQAFRIDAVGDNRNLVSESMGADGIFQAGETWQFIIQDFVNTDGVGADSMGSLDFAGGSSFFGDALSSGSIVQFVVPAPGSTALAGLGALVAVRRRRA